MLSTSDHSFVICAYQDSPYLEACIQSLINQTLEPHVVLATSTPSRHIDDLCARYKIDLNINKNGGGIATDWNFALSVTDSKLVTIAHQDDLYCPNYLESMIAMVGDSKDPLLYFTNYGELRGEQKVDDSSLLRTKRALLNPLKSGRFKGSKFVRRRVLSFGSAICCPSVTLMMDKIDQPFFKHDYRSNLDWQAWAELALHDGDYLYDPQILMYHRIHEDSETSRLILDSSRSEEDKRMLQYFWPKPIANLINIAYARGQKSNSR